MRIKLIIYCLGLLSGVSVWLISNQIAKFQHTKAIEEYLAYYDEYEFIVESSDQLDINRLKLIDLIDLNNERTNICINSNKVLFLNLWATWSQPCVEQLDGIENLRKEFGDKIEFYLISSESVRQLKKHKIKTNSKLPYYSYQNEDLLPKYLKKGTIPLTLIIYKGSVWFEHLGAAPWDSKKIINLINDIIN